MKQIFVCFTGSHFLTELWFNPTWWELNILSYWTVWPIKWIWGGSALEVYNVWNSRSKSVYIFIIFNYMKLFSTYSFGSIFRERSSSFSLKNVRVFHFLWGISSTSGGFLREEGLISSPLTSLCSFLPSLFFFYCLPLFSRLLMFLFYPNNTVAALMAECPMSPRCSPS